MFSAIEAKNLQFSYHTDQNAAPKIVLQNISFSVADGSFTAILGHNGSGKSTLAKLMNSVLLPEGGTVYAYGMDTLDESLSLEIRRRVGLVFQNPDNQIVSNVVEEDVAFAPENLGVDPLEIRTRVEDALEAVEMLEYRDHAPHLLSGGQKQRIAIAGILAMEPRCIVFDEPTAMLDPKGRADVMRIIHKLNRERGVTVILITHHMEETIDADRLIVMKNGGIALDGTPKEVFSQVETMRELGLDVPVTVQVLYELKMAGLEVPLDALSTEECAQAIYHALHG